MSLSLTLTANWISLKIERPDGDFLNKEPAEDTLLNGLQLSSADKPPGTKEEANATMTASANKGAIMKFSPIRNEVVRCCTAYFVCPNAYVHIPE